MRPSRWLRVLCVLALSLAGLVAGGGARVRSVGEGGVVKLGAPEPWAAGTVFEVRRGADLLGFLEVQQMPER